MTGRVKSGALYLWTQRNPEPRESRDGNAADQTLKFDGTTFNYWISQRKLQIFVRQTLRSTLLNTRRARYWLMFEELGIAHLGVADGEMTDLPLRTLGMASR